MKNLNIIQSNIKDSMSRVNFLDLSEKYNLSNECLYDLFYILEPLIENLVEEKCEGLVYENENIMDDITENKAEIECLKEDKTNLYKEIKDCEEVLEKNEIHKLHNKIWTLEMKCETLEEHNYKLINVNMNLNKEKSRVTFINL